MSDERTPLVRAGAEPINWEFPGWGSSQNIISLPSDKGGSLVDVLSSQSSGPAGVIFTESDTPLLGTTDLKIDLSHSKHVKVHPVDTSSHTKINQWLATAICGNDITASIFYTTGICASYAGKWAPVSLMIVCLVLYLFRKVYGEVGSALPLNGGAYNVLLNTTSKAMASFAACLTLISYVATAVVSASSAITYLHGLNGAQHAVDIFWFTILLLFFFALLNLIGIGESAVVALIIFVIHMGTLLLLVGCCIYAFIVEKDHSIMRNNWNDPSPHSFVYSIYFGFGAAMLGISGFETSSNFIEQQQEGVFPKTLRNMWVTVTFFNPIIGVLAIFLVPLTKIVSSTDGVLADLAESANLGEWLSIVVRIDAFLVLSGSVITSYVGVIGLARRMSLDRCLPQFLLATNKWRETNHWIILIFFAVCSSLYWAVGGNTTTLAGVYTIAFLGVMSLFAMGNMLLKYKRSTLPRDIRASWPGVLVALIAVLAGLVATIISNPLYIEYFAIYFVVTAVIISIMFLRISLLKIVLFFTKILLKKFGRTRVRAINFISSWIQDINSQCVVFFASKDDPAYLNKAILYIRDNELTSWIKVVHVYEGDAPPAGLVANIAFLDRCYPKIRLDLVSVKGTFNPETVEKLSQIFQVQKNFMFFACPHGDQLPHAIAAFGGVRMITH